MFVHGPSLGRGQIGDDWEEYVRTGTRRQGLGNGLKMVLSVYIGEAIVK